MNLDKMIAALQLLAQRQVLEDKASKPCVTFYMEKSFFVASVQMIDYSTVPPKIKFDYKEVGSSYTEAVAKLCSKLSETLAQRHKEDQQVLSLADVLAPENSFQAVGSRMYYEDKTDNGKPAEKPLQELLASILMVTWMLDEP